MRIFSVYTEGGTAPHTDDHWLILNLRYFRYANTPPTDDRPLPTWYERWSNAELLHEALLEMWPLAKVMMRLCIPDEDPAYLWTDYRARGGEPPNSLAACWPGIDADAMSTAPTFGQRLARWLLTR
jgi:hypothetical protein